MTTNTTRRALQRRVPYGAGNREWREALAAHEREVAAEAIEECADIVRRVFHVPIVQEALAKTLEDLAAARRTGEA